MAIKMSLPSHSFGLMTFFRYIPLACLISLILGPLHSQACTLWAALAGRVQGGGALVAKTRDMPPNHQQELRLVKPDKGFRYVGLFAVTGSRPGLKDGINEKGLVILGSAASCLPAAERNRFSGPADLLERILTTCDGVDAVLANLGGFTHPAFFLVADRQKAVLIEVGLSHERRIRVADRGAITQTNHYQDADFQCFNRTEGLSTALRLQRINFLLRSHKEPLTLADGVRFMEDRRDGPDNGIWRTGSTPKKIRTLAAWVALLPPEAPPTLHVKLANPGQPVKTYSLRLDGAFWTKDAISP
jgi:hypothetical protein